MTDRCEDSAGSLDESLSLATTEQLIATLMKRHNHFLAVFKASPHMVLRYSSSVFEALGLARVAEEYFLDLVASGEDEEDGEDDNNSGDANPGANDGVSDFL